MAERKNAGASAPALTSASAPCEEAAGVGYPGGLAARLVAASLGACQGSLCEDRAPLSHASFLAQHQAWHAVGASDRMNARCLGRGACCLLFLKHFPRPLCLVNSYLPLKPQLRCHLVSVGAESGR